MRSCCCSMAGTKTCFTCANNNSAPVSVYVSATGTRTFHEKIYRLIDNNENIDYFSFEQAVY